MRLPLYPLYLNVEMVLSDDGRVLTGASGLASSHIGSISIPDGIESIRKGTFKDCINLTEIHLPASVIDIEQGTFDDCLSLTDIEVVEDNMQYMSEEGILYDRKRLSVVRMPRAKTKSSVRLPEWIWSVDAGAFKYCKYLKEITIPYGVKTIGASAFYGCRSIEEFQLPSTVEEYGEGVFEECESMKRLVIPMGCREIPKSMFSWCYRLEEVTIPSSVVKIGSWAFDGCTRLRKVDMPSAVTVIGYGAFRNCNSLVSFHLPDGLTEIKGETFNSCSNIKNIVIPEGVRHVGDSAIRLCESLKFLSLPSTLEGTSFGAFGQCHMLQQVQCNSKNPDGISMSASAFLDMDLSHCKLYVPQGTEQAYRGHRVFGLFGLIKGMRSKHLNKNTSSSTMTVEMVIVSMIEKLRKRIRQSSGCGYLYHYFDDLVRELESLEKDKMPTEVSTALQSLIQDYAADCIYNTHSSANWVRYSARCFYCADYLMRYLPEPLRQTMESSLNGYFLRLTKAGVAPVLPEDVLDKYIEMNLKTKVALEVYDNLIKQAIDGSNRFRIWDDGEVGLALLYLRSVSRLIHQYISIHQDYTMLKVWVPLLRTKWLAKVWYEYPDGRYYCRADRYIIEAVSRYLDEMLEIHLSIIGLWYWNSPQEMIENLELDDLIEVLEVSDDEEFEKTLRHMVTLPFNDKVERILEHFTHDDESWIVDLSFSLLEKYKLKQ